MSYWLETGGSLQCCSISGHEMSVDDQSLVTLEPESQRKAEAAFSMAKRHLAAAERDATAGDFPHAYSNLVLSAEEEAKYILYKAVALGVATFDPSESSDHILLREKDLTAHPIKQRMFGLATLLYTILFASLELATRRAEGEELTQGKIITTLLSALQSITENTPSVGNLEDKKQSGLYSGDVTMSGAKASPATQEEYIRLHAVLEDRLRLHSLSLTESIPLKILEDSKARMRGFRNEHGTPKKGDLSAMDSRGNRGRSARGTVSGD